MESQLINNNISAIEEEEEILIGHEKKKKGLIMKPPDHDKRPWADLPSDVLNYIFPKLSDFDCILFRLTCKEWELAVNNNSPSIPPRIIKSNHYLLTLFPYWRMFFSEGANRGVFDFLHPMTNASYTLHIPELANCTFHCSSYGWLLMSRHTTTTTFLFDQPKHIHCSFFFYNPLIPKSTINLPDFPEYNISPMSMSFTAPPTSPNCIVFANESRLKKYYTCRRGEDHWRSIDDNILMPLEEFDCTPVFYKGVFYQLDREGRLVTMDTNNSKEHLSVLPKPTRPNIPDTVSHYKKYIAECDGEFVSVFVDSALGYSVHVFKLDWSEMEWVTLKSLGNRTMFIGETTTTGCLLVPAAKTIYQNRIYFPNFRNKGYGRRRSYLTTKDTCLTTKDRTCVYYSLETCKFHAGCDFSSENLSGTARLLNSVWIEPNLTISTTQDEVEDNWFN